MGAEAPGGRLFGCLPLSLKISHIPALVSSVKLHRMRTIFVVVDNFAYSRYIIVNAKTQEKRRAGMWLKEWVVKNNINRLEFAKTLGVAPTTFSGYCSGDRMPSPAKILLLHNLSGGQVSFADFYNDRLDPKLEIAQ